MESLIAPLLLALRLVLVLALYTFLAWALIVMWRDLKSQSLGLDQLQAPPIRLNLLGNEANEAEYYHQNEITIGRHPSNHWVLNDETVSARHARLIFHHEQWWLEDLGSRNGTFLSNEELSEAVVLNNEGEVRCGQVRFAISLAAQETSGGDND